MPERRPVRANRAQLKHALFNLKRRIENTERQDKGGEKRQKTQAKSERNEDKMRKVALAMAEKSRFTTRKSLTRAVKVATAQEVQKIAKRLKKSAQEEDSSAERQRLLEGEFAGTKAVRDYDKLVELLIYKDEMLRKHFFPDADANSAKASYRAISSSIATQMLDAVAQERKEESDEQQFDAEKLAERMQQAIARILRASCVTTAIQAAIVSINHVNEHIAAVFPGASTSSPTEGDASKSGDEERSGDENESESESDGESDGESGSESANERDTGVEGGSAHDDTARSSAVDEGAASSVFVESLGGSDTDAGSDVESRDGDDASSPPKKLDFGKFTEKNTLKALVALRRSRTTVDDVMDYLREGGAFAKKAKKSNRPGQRARQKIREVERAKVTRELRGRPDRGGARAPRSSETRKAEKPAKRAAEPEEDLHPSWKAKREAKKMAASVLEAKGERIAFDSDSD